MGDELCRGSQIPNGRRPEIAGSIVGHLWGVRLLEYIDGDKHAIASFEGSGEFG